MDPMLLLRGVGLATGFALHVAPLMTMREILAARSTLNFHISTYGFSLINQATNLWYALVRDDTALIIHRTLGVIFNIYYVYIFLTYCPPARLSEFTRTLLRLGAIFVLFFVDLHMFLPLSGNSAQYMSHIALFGAITGIGSTAGPLATVGEVLRTRDASSLPLPYLSMVTLQCATWTLYGYLRDDLSTFINNLVGVILGSIQLLLIFWLPSKRHHMAAGGEAVGGAKKGHGSSSSGGAGDSELGAGPLSSGGGASAPSLPQLGSGGANSLEDQPVATVGHSLPHGLVGRAALVAAAGDR